MKLFLKNKVFNTLFITITLLVTSVTVAFIDRVRYEEKRLSVQNNAISVASQIRNSVNQALAATYALATFVQQQDGNIHDFDALASNLIDYYPSASAIQLSPAGVIQHSYPLKGNERAIGVDLLSGAPQHSAAMRALKTRSLTMSKPIKLIQGGTATIGRLPIYLKTPETENAFWGFSNVVIRFPDVVNSVDIDTLSQLGLAYRLSHIDPQTNDRTILSATDAALADDPVLVPIEFEDTRWHLEVAPVKGWHSGYRLLMDLLVGISFCLIVFITVILIRKFRQDKVSLEQAVEERTQTIQSALRHTELALRTARQSWFEINLDTGDIWVGDEYPALLEYTPEEFDPHIDKLKDGIHPDDIDELHRMLNSFTDTNEPKEIEFRRRTKSGYWIWLHAIAERIDSDDEGTMLIGVVTDISRRKHTEVLESARLQVLEQLVNNKPLPEIFHSIIGMIENTSRGALCSILLMDDERKHLHKGAAPNLPDFYNEAIEGIAIGEGIGSCGTAAFLRERVIVEDISTHPFWAPFTELATSAGLAACWSEPILAGDGDILGTFAIYHDRPTTPSDEDLEVISFAARLVMLAIEKTSKDNRLSLLSRVFDEADEGIIVTDEKANIVDVNPMFSEITGYGRDDALNRNPSFLASGDQDASFYRQLWRSLKKHGSWRGELWNLRKDGERFIEQLTISSITDVAGQTTNYVGIFSDITQLKSQQQALEMMAYHDVLTGLPNRVLMTDRFHQATARCKRTGTLLAVCFLDLDNFKQVNDRYGHSVGDQLLVQVSQRILKCIREEDTACRLGGDEFAILIGDIQSSGDCKEALSRIHESISEPYHIDSHTLNITASSGITIYPEDQVDIDTLLRHADQAMYRVKLDGKNNFDLFNAQDDQNQIETHNKRRDIEDALRHEQFVLFYQPKVNMCTGEVWGVEALIRWQHPAKGLLSPFHFLPVVTGTSLDIGIGNWVLGEALRQLNEWHKQGLMISVSINVSAYHLLTPNFETELTARLAQYPEIDTRYVQLEILESTAFGNLDAINTVIEHCRSNLGVSFALDDFGTGFSSLAHLRNLNADNIKIDCSFVTHLMSSPDDFRIVDGVIRLAEAFDRNVIAEGVETVWEGQMLLLMGCENAQGYGIARPMPADQLPGWLKQYKPFTEWAAFADRDLTPRDTMIALFRLSMSYWYWQFERALMSAPHAQQEWPNTSSIRSHSYAWSLRCRKDGLIPVRILDSVNANRKQLYRAANDAIKLYKQGDIQAARKRLPEVYELVEIAQNEFGPLDETARA